MFLILGGSPSYAQPAPDLSNTPEFAGAMGALPGAPDITANTFSAPDTAPNIQVATRPRPEYDPLGMRLGSFLISADLTESLGYVSNLFADASDKAALAEETVGRLSANSGWSRNSVYTELQFDDLRYPVQEGSGPNQDRTNWSAGFGGTFEIDHATVSLHYNHLFAHRDRTAIDGFGFDAPTAFHNDDLQLSAVMPFSRLSVTSGFEFLRLRFNDGTFLGSPLINTVSNRDVYMSSLLLRYELQPRRYAVLYARDVQSQFLSTPAGTPSSDSSGNEVLAGLDYDVDSVIRVQALLGYEFRNFHSPAFPDRSAPTAHGEVVWTPTELTTVSASLNRTIEDAINSDVVGFTYTSTAVHVEHEYSRNVLLGAYAEVSEGGYTDSGQTSRLYRGGISVTWLESRNLRLTGSYDWASRDSPSQGNYGRSTVFLKVQVSL
jgi:hypothetical protein